MSSTPNGSDDPKVIGWVEAKLAEPVALTWEQVRRFVEQPIHPRDPLLKVTLTIHAEMPAPPHVVVDAGEATTVYPGGTTTVTGSHFAMAGEWLIPAACHLFVANLVHYMQLAVGLHGTWSASMTINFVEAKVA